MHGRAISALSSLVRARLAITMPQFRLAQRITAMGSRPLVLALIAALSLPAPFVASARTQTAPAAAAKPIPDWYVRGVAAALLALPPRARQARPPPPVKPKRTGKPRGRPRRSATSAPISPKRQHNQPRATIR